MAILLCSHNELIRKRWDELLSPQYQLVEAASLGELEAVLAAEKIELLLLHRTMVDMNITAQVRRQNPRCKIFLLSDRPDEDEGLSFLKLGIVGYSNTYISPPRLSEAVRIVLAGSVWIGQQVMQRLIRETLAAASGASAGVSYQAPAVLDSLTTREREIAEMVARGQANLEIAANLGITERTVKAHLSAVYTKTGTGSRLNLALLINRGGSLGRPQ
ncbi:MAG: hypothetical protein A2521_16735 [Deltaproteobacteria bacterium RIFOXYD12_FULL_57_12]|nr:MAG: hypothetical protein A2521_16735 [Deltaproteobacteria bacterium RIFOXYD12_FULL_57_12]